MYSFQFQDGTFRIARRHPSSVPFGRIIENKEAFKLFEGVYETRAEADAALVKLERLMRPAEGLYLGLERTA